MGEWWKQNGMRQSKYLKTENEELNKVLKKHRIKSVGELDEILKVYFFLGGTDYVAIERDTYKAMLRDCKEYQKIKG